jgi:hypothetical protein
MPDPINLPGVLHAHCGSLRCKEMFTAEDPMLALSTSGSGIFWCTHTQNCLGPDGEVAEPGSCKPGRSCYQTL